MAAVAGNPWREFLATVESELGSQPRVLDIEAADLRLLASSINVTDLAQVFRGPVAVRFAMAGSGTEYEVADASIGTAPAGLQIELGARFYFLELAAPDIADLLTGSFQVVFVGQSHGEFRRLRAVADLIVGLQVGAR
jgi:hypothetical protein